VRRLRRRTTVDAADGSVRERVTVTSPPSTTSSAPSAGASSSGERSAGSSNCARPPCSASVRRRVTRAASSSGSITLHPLSAAVLRGRVGSPALGIGCASPAPAASTTESLRGGGGTSAMNQSWCAISVSSTRCESVCAAGRSSSAGCESRPGRKITARSARAVRWEGARRGRTYWTRPSGFCPPAREDGEEVEDVEEQVLVRAGHRVDEALVGGNYLFVVIRVVLCRVVRTGRALDKQKETNGEHYGTSGSRLVETHTRSRRTTCFMVHIDGYNGFLEGQRQYHAEDWLN
jgi:hypothetical protein